MRPMGKADTHIHTEYSGFSYLGVTKCPESVTTPEQQVEKARKNGMDVLGITDHDETKGAFIGQKYAERYKDIEVIVGEEVTTADGEVIGLFLTEKIPKGLPVEETIDIIRSQGGLVIAPHPFSFHVFGLKEQIFNLDIDGFETINGGHPDRYSNHFAQKVMDAYPGRWAAMSGSDAHSLYTSGFNWTEFDGNTAEDFRKAVLNKKTRAVGVPANVFTQVQWSVDVAWGGSKLLYKSLKGKLVKREDDRLAEKIESISNLKKATGMVAATAYILPPISILATLLSTTYLNIGAKKMLKQEDERMRNIDEILREVDAKKA